MKSMQAFARFPSALFTLQEFYRRFMQGCNVNTFFFTCEHDTRLMIVLYHLNYCTWINPCSFNNKVTLVLCTWGDTFIAVTMNANVNSLILTYVRWYIVHSQECIRWGIKRTLKTSKNILKNVLFGGKKCMNILNEMYSKLCWKNKYCNKCLFKSKHDVGLDPWCP